MAIEFGVDELNFETQLKPIPLELTGLDDNTSISRLITGSSDLEATISPEFKEFRKQLDELSVPSEAQKFTFFVLRNVQEFTIGQLKEILTNPDKVSQLPRKTAINPSHLGALKILFNVG